MAQSLCFTVWHKPFPKARLKPLNVSVHAPNLEEAKRAYRAKRFNMKRVIFRREATCTTPGSNNQCSCAKLVAYTSDVLTGETPYEKLHKTMMEQQKLD